MTDYEEHDRVDGRALRPLTEPGSDARLSHEARAKITRRRLEDDDKDAWSEYEPED